MWFGDGGFRMANSRLTCLVTTINWGNRTTRVGAVTHQARVVDTFPASLGRAELVGPVAFHSGLETLSTTTTDTTFVLTLVLWISTVLWITILMNEMSTGHVCDRRASRFF